MSQLEPSTDPDRGGQRVPAITVEPLGVVFEVHDGETLIQAAWREGYYWPTTCKGKGECSACGVEILEGMENLGEPERDERITMELLMARFLARTGGRMRLACRIHPTGDAVVTKKGVRLLNKDVQGNALGGNTDQ